MLLATVETDRQDAPPAAPACLHLIDRVRRESSLIGYRMSLQTRGMSWRRFLARSTLSAPWTSAVKPAANVNAGGSPSYADRLKANAMLYGPIGVACHV